MAEFEIDDSEVREVLAHIRMRSANPDRAILGELLLSSIDDVIETELLEQAGRAQAPVRGGTWPPDYVPPAFSRGAGGRRPDQQDRRHGRARPQP